MKTVCTGTGGWADRRLSEGTIQWTSPSGHIYTTKPAGALFFLALATPTAEIATTERNREPCQCRGLKMPARRRTRAAERSARIAAERQINEARIAEARRKREEWLAATYEPPF